MEGFETAMGQAFFNDKLSESQINDYMEELRKQRDEDAEEGQGLDGLGIDQIMVLRQSWGSSTMPWGPPSSETGIGRVSSVTRDRYLEEYSDFEFWIYSRALSARNERFQVVSAGVIEL